MSDPLSLPTRDEYRIGIVCALPVEKAAVEEMLDIKHPNLKMNDDGNDYTFGRIGVHNVVIACLPAGLTGIGEAATVASNMRRSFPIRFGLMVGVGGGVWSTKVDVRLGDVIIGQRDRQHGSVVQWDFETTEKGAEFCRTGSQNKPPRILLHAVQTLKMRHWKEESRVSEYLSVMYKKRPRMAAKFSYQGAEHDVLFEATYDHENGRACDGCDRNQEVERPARPSVLPEIHYGNIASGSQVMKHGVTRDRVAKDLGVICFEMEAAGLDDFPCLVIRGICDYADSHKNDKWQPYAAATAAAFARELLHVINKQEVDELAPASVLSQSSATTEQQDASGYGLAGEGGSTQSNNFSGTFYISGGKGLYANTFHSVGGTINV
jgi:nucleoside phosphorylase